jgi:tetratricopeptide (TPR) repeat protein
MYLRTMNLYHYAILEQVKFYETGKTLVQIIESQPHFLREHIADYIAALSNLILSCGMLRKYNEVRICLEKLRHLTPITQDDRQKIHRQYYSNLFALCTYTGAFEEARREIDNCKQEAKFLDSKDYETVSFVYQYCFISFGCGDYEVALGYLNQWLSMPRSVEREDLQSLARMLLLILHYEMNNNLLLESLLRSTMRFLKKKNRLYTLERRFVLAIGELLRQSTDRDRKTVFERMKSELEQEANQAAARSLLQTFDFLAWIESKITGKTFATVVQQKSGANQP